MSGDVAVVLLSRLLWTALLASSPVLAATLLVGLAVSILQAVTQLQESTLSYVPKLIAAGIVLVVAGGWMLSRITTFAVELYRGIAAVGQ
ncbi:flagellar biosynthetic protein FliQ [Burkholderia ubonensis]|uniref:flagellar biosynthetic protein FliQ n=1 Tax=Burkholderia ubonensis TaxID=101571 RepID=UPI00084136C6|nr:flagellar biosynthetic protein FliQ [Burkholderia ubonensis]